MAKLLFFFNLVVVFIATVALSFKHGFVDWQLIFKEVLVNLAFLWMIDALALIILLCTAWKVGLVKFFCGYRKCSQCNEIFHKDILQSIEVMTGITDSESRYFCNSCADAYLKKTSLGHGPFSYMAREVSGRFPNNSL